MRRTDSTRRQRAASGGLAWLRDAGEGWTVDVMDRGMCVGAARSARTPRRALRAARGMQVDVAQKKTGAEVAAVARMTPCDEGREGGFDVVAVGRPCVTWFAGVEVVVEPYMMDEWSREMLLCGVRRLMRVTSRRRWW